MTDHAPHPMSLCSENGKPDESFRLYGYLRSPSLWVSLSREAKENNSKIAENV
jgi:hypothetical protein